VGLGTYFLEDIYFYRGSVEYSNKDCNRLYKELKVRYFADKACDQEQATKRNGR
jgi:hypothetical protein